MNSTRSNIVILTGAGVSAESGVATFRGAGGLWEGHLIEDVASPEGFARDPALVQKFYNLRRAALRTVEPNAAHRAIARLQREYQRGRVTLVTQNVDDLHERSGSPQVIHVHGELLKIRCTRCHAVHHWTEDITPNLACASCQTAGRLRPDIVWFGEMPYHMDAIYDELAAAQVFIAIGTSGKVYPAAGFVIEAARCGARTIECNLEPSDVSSVFDEHRIGPAGVIAPALVDQLLRV
ncbi:MAG: NAD-dependent protein deacylase [Verrucomicrobiaceae bacterium]|nr:NAD-dependent protein deacylase [Verrucomicrobiaceae bacterium]